MTALEDDEDDDADTSVEDDPRGFDPEEDYGGEELGEEDPFETDSRPIADPAALEFHRDRIRRTRCDKRVYQGPGWRDVKYVLRDHRCAIGSAVDLID